MSLRRSTAALAILAAAAGVAGLVTLGAPSATAADGLFIYTGASGQQFIPFPTEDKCYATPGGKTAMNYTRGDAYLYTDGYCTIGKDAGNVPPFGNNNVAFQGVRLRTSAS